MEHVEELRDMWEGGHFAAPGAHEEVIKNSAAQGACSAYRQIEALNYEDMMGVRNVSTESRTDAGDSDQY